MCDLQEYAVPLPWKYTYACPLVSVINYGDTVARWNKILWGLVTAGMPEETCQVTHPHAGNSVYAASLIFLA